MIYQSRLNNKKYIDISDVKKQIKEHNNKVVSLFSGAGGLDIGLELAGFNTTLCIENDIDCRETLRHNRPEWILFEESHKIENNTSHERIPGDIRDISPNEVLNYCNLKKGDFSLVVGGAPCQPFSNIGKKLGKDDEKNGDLFLEFVKMVKGLQPQAFIFENVVGITQKRHSEVILYMIEKLQGLGYGISHDILNAANYGVPQRRERFFLIGIKGIDNPAFPLPTHFKDINHYESFINDLSEFPKKNSFKRWVSVKDAFDKIPDDAPDRSDYAVMNVSDIIKRRMSFIKQGQNFKALPMNMRPNCWKSGSHEGTDTFGRLVADSPSVTIRTAAYNPTKGMYIHPFENRGLSTIEMAALQSFPYNWEFKTKKRNNITLVSGGKQIGNAVPPLLAKALGLAIAKQLPTK